MLFIAHYAAKKHSRLGNNVSFTTRVRETNERNDYGRLTGKALRLSRDAHLRAAESGVISNSSDVRVLL